VHVEIVRRRADDLDVRVLPLVYDLLVAVLFRLHFHDMVGSCGDRLRVVRGQPPERRGLDSRLRHARRIHLEQCRTEAGDAVPHGLLRAVSKRDHRDHGADADDDAEHGEERAQLVGAQRVERDAGDFEQEHWRLRHGGDAYGRSSASADPLHLLRLA